jgi:hypothetical protein
MAQELAEAAALLLVLPPIGRPRSSFRLMVGVTTIPGNRPIQEGA